VTKRTLDSSQDHAVFTMDNPIILVVNTPPVNASDASICAWCV